MAYCWLYAPFLIVYGTIFVPKQADGEPCLTKIFGSRGSNKVLVNHVISTRTVTSAAMCEIQCYIEITCESYNYGVMNNGSHVCELSDSDAIRDPLDLTTRQGFVYRGTENSCIIAQCPPNSRCYSDFENNTHSCVCLPRFVGENCGTEIIDCESSVISCHVNALCIRVKESLGCLCKEGFQGDGIICTDVDECSQGSHGCHLNASCVNTVGSYNCSCKLGFDGDGFNCRARKGFSSEKPAKTCAEVLNNTKNAPNGGYFLQLEDGNVQKTYCHMADIPGCGGGIWTLVMKINGSLLTFGYDSPYWSDQLSFNVNGGATGFDWEETKLPSYWSTPFTKLCLGMRVGESTRSIAVDYNASSLYSLLADGAYRPTSLGRNTWKSLIDDSSLQNFCDMEGFNAYPSEIDAVKARIGIIANDQNSCASCDSTIGFGTEVRVLEDTCGNDAAWSTDNGDRHTKAHCYILLQ